MAKLLFLLGCLLISESAFAQETGIIIGSNVPEYLAKGAAADQRKLANLPAGAKVIVRMPSGKTQTYFGAKSALGEMPIGATRRPPD